MSRCRILLTAILLSAVAGAPAMAAAIPCCCVAPRSRPAACCQREAKAAEASKHACCSRHEAAPVEPEPMLTTGCCCVRSLPPADRLADSRSVTVATLGEFTAIPMADVPALLAARESLPPAPGLGFPDRPSVSVLFGVWRN